MKKEQKVAAEYPYERAEGFKKDIRKLGVNESGLSYLDQFRKLITEIGNALGFVRMVRLGAATFSHTAVRFMSVGAKLGVHHEDGNGDLERRAGGGPHGFCVRLRQVLAL